jgi:hypothetical protein
MTKTVQASAERAAIASMAAAEKEAIQARQRDWFIGKSLITAFDPQHEDKPP